MKHKVLLFISVAFIMLVIAFIAYIYPATQPLAQREDPCYLSFTVLHNKDEASVYEYNLQTHEVSEIFRFPFDAMYSLGIYDKAANRVFYSKKCNDNTPERGDQIFMYELDKGAETKLTEDLFAVNYILPVDSAVFFLAATRENRDSLIVGKIDLTNNKVQYWDEAATASSHILSIDREKERLYVSIFNTEEADAAFSTQPDLVPTHTIYSFDYDLGDKREILRKENMNIRAVYARNDLMMYTVQDTLVPEETSYTLTQVIDLNSREVLFESDKRFSQEGCFSADTAGVYSFASVGDFYGITYFDLSTQEYTPILNEYDEDGYIANFQMMQEKE